LDLTISRTSIQRGQKRDRIVQKSRSRAFQGRPRSHTLQNCQLLPQGEDFEGDVAAILEEDPDGGEDLEDELGHERTVVTRRNLTPAG
jgi:hypothetical protein